MSKRSLNTGAPQEKKKKARRPSQNGMPGPGEGRISRVYIQVEVCPLDEKGKEADGSLSQPLSVYAAHFDKPIKQILLERGFDSTHME